MKVIGIVGSHNPEGNTAEMVSGFLEGAESRGAETSIFILGKMEINPCYACEACRGGNGCVQQDGMQGLYRALEDADHVVLGSPIYFDHIAARTKAFIDRLYPYYQNRRLGLTQTIIQTYGWDQPGEYAEPLEYVRSRLKHYFNIETTGTLNIHGTVGSPVTERPEELERARNLGEACVGAQGSQ
ncbi:flavodoxin family protein [Candidatus Bathyarchaeota archaeon]|nr:flavodoxin family protein [Candidatus Bathyarchaeota archaeon]